jgi:hypothetical protein
VVNYQERPAKMGCCGGENDFAESEAIFTNDAFMVVLLYRK